MTKRKSRALCAAILAASAGLAGIAAGDDRNFNVADGQWNVAGNWLEGAVPGGGDNCYINGGRVARIGAYAANANFLQLGWNAGGYLYANAGLLTVGTTAEIGGPAGGTGTGYMEFTGSGQMIANDLYIARHVGNSGLNFSSSMAMRIDNDALVGGRGLGYVTQNSGIIQIRRDLSLGNFDGGRGEYRILGGNTSVERDIYVGWANTGTGKIEVGAAGQLGLVGTMYVGQFGVAPAVHGEVINSGGLIYGTPGARVVVQGSKARLVGAGTYNLNVRFESDRIFGQVNKSVAVQFRPGVLTRSSRFNTDFGLTGSSGNAAARNSLLSSSLSDTAVHITWGDAAFNQEVNYSNQVTTPANYMAVDVPYNVNSIPDTPALPRADVVGRIRLMQVGARRWDETNTEIAGTLGQIRNLTTEVVADAVHGVSPDVYGSWDATVVGRPVAVQHQDPAFRTLHGGPWNLSGQGILMGQLEPGLPDVAHGAFEDWAHVSNRRVRLSTAAANLPATRSPHATFVASIMVGNDPLGLQTNGQGQLIAAANGYGVNGSTERGFVGIAPRARLVSRDWTDATGTFADITNLAGQNDPQFGAMRIINISAGFAQTNPLNPRPTGDNPEERALDRLAETNGIIVTKSAGNNGTINGGAMNLSMPAGIYNGIVVGAVEFDRGVGGAAADNQSYPQNFNVANATVANFSSRGPTNPDAAANSRSKPDIVAQGVGNLGAYSYERVQGASIIRDPAYPMNEGRGLYSTQQRLNQTTVRANPGTSYAAPTVAGTAALMVELESRPGRAGIGADPRVVKSILQTTADKPAGWEKGANDGGGDDSSQIPLSFDWGAGLLDPVGAVSLLSVGPVPNPGFILDDNWAFANIANGDSANFRGRDTDGVIRILSGDRYQLTGIAPNSPITLTLNWYSHVSNANARQALSNIFLELYSLDNAGIWQPIADSLSNSPVDNLQHVYLPQYAAGGSVMARVFLGANLPGGLANETYALSWEYNAVPAPGVLALVGVGGLLASRRRRL